MTVEEALGLVEEVRNCSLPWDDEHWEALCIVTNYVKDKLHEDFQNTWKPSDEQMKAFEWAYKSSKIEEGSQYDIDCKDLLEQLKAL